MTAFHVIGYWYLAITLAGIAALSTFILVEFLGQTLWKKMTRLRDIYVLNWWIHALKQSGFLVPTKGNIQELRRKMDLLDNMTDDKGDQ